MMMNKMKHSVKSFQGVTLVELMAVVAILGILMSVALPWYGDYVMRGNRADALKPMQSIMDAQERYYNDNVTYTTDLTELGFSASTLTSSKGFYSVQARACTDSGGATLPLTQCIELRATAQGNQVEDGILVQDSMGKQQRIVGSEIRDWNGF